ncbi:LOW QUALITY PROTEIN: transmembrane protein 221 [Monodelphis domestica]|uniref:LOW QUALITY PROTEIN: transmembrane protein 221 n=1 Tax=Monodelphis domestica TaxID=13616 RepID=UPI0024E1EDF2|nr:LOW QUALITY PROTEIN: transmembrane protein 221 [Monodelphis domestica]
MPWASSGPALSVLVLLGILAAVMSLLSSQLLFQLQAGRAELWGRNLGMEGAAEGATGVLLPLASALSALCLALNLCALFFCLLLCHLSAELARTGPDRADWFLSDSRCLRHVSIGFFCCGVSVYLAALSIYMLLLFEMETGIIGACILSSGIMVLLITLTHVLLRASKASHRRLPEPAHTLYENNSARPTRDLYKQAPGGRARPDIHREFSYPPFLEARPHLASSSLPTGNPAPVEEGSCAAPRMHRTLSAESGCWGARARPWNGVAQEMRGVLSRKTGSSGKDSTLV